MMLSAGLCRHSLVGYDWPYLRPVSDQPDRIAVF